MIRDNYTFSEGIKSAMERISFSVMPKTVSMSVAIKMDALLDSFVSTEPFDEILGDAESKIQSVIDDTSFVFKRFQIGKALVEWINEKRVSDGLIMHIMIRGHVVEVSAQELRSVSIGRRGELGNLDSKGKTELIISYIY